MQSWCQLGSILVPKPSKSRLEDVLRHLGGILERLGGVLGRLGKVLERLGGVLGHLGAVLGRLGGALMVHKASFKGLRPATRQK